MKAKTTVKSGNKLVTKNARPFEPFKLIEVGI